MKILNKTVSGIFISSVISLPGANDPVFRNNFIASIWQLSTPCRAPTIPFSETISLPQFGNCQLLAGRQRSRFQKQFHCLNLAIVNSLIRPVWSESSLCAQWVVKGLMFLHADSEDSDQTGPMSRLIWVFVWCTCHFVGFVMRRLKFE